MERVTLITNARLRNAIDRYSRYIVICIRHVKTDAGRMQLNWLLNVANSMRSNAIECSTLRNKHRVNRLNRETLVIIECSCEIWSDLYYTRAFEISKDMGPYHTQRAQRILRASHRLLNQISAEIGR